MKAAGVAVTAFALFAVLVSGGILWLGGVERGSGRVVTETRDVRGFDRIALDGPGTLIVKQGARESLTIAAEDNIIRRIDTDVRGGRLAIGFDRGGRPSITIRPTRPVVYTVTVTDLSALDLAGSGAIEAADITTDRLRVAVDGSGDVRLGNIATRDLTLSITGSGGVEASGTTDAQAVTISGSGDYRAGALRSKHARVTVEGSGDAAVRASDTLDVRISGSGAVEYAGNPQAHQDISGSGEVRCLRQS